jgi:membrane protein required for colicin V production
MNLVDVVVAVIVAWSALRGAYRGFVTQTIVVASIVAGAVVAFAVYGYSHTWWGRGGEFTLLALRFLVSLTAGLLVFGLLQVAAERIGRRANESVLGPLNRTGGLVLGLVWGIALAAFTLLLSVSVPLPRPVRHAVHASWSAPRLFRLGEEVAWMGAPGVPGSRWLAEGFHAASRGRAAPPSEADAHRP